MYLAVHITLNLHITVIKYFFNAWLTFIHDIAIYVLLEVHVMYTCTECLNIELTCLSNVTTESSLMTEVKLS